MPNDHPDWITEGRRALGERIADMRAAAHYTQESFCEATGLSRRNLQRIERGEADPRFSELMRIAAALDTRVTVLIND
ncbi:helix-turn-helix domain-containing protein [Streptomyces sp. NPDC058534]|uniref:helix-turn-helix domain-containing protein n=1 Tax=Streptomyces sp. NPDC058534 TaxID=3346541 RepID=UPI003646D911